MRYKIRDMSFDEYAKLYPKESARSPIETYVLTDPLSENSRKKRKMLLGSGAFGIVMAKAELVPTKIAALGIEFTKTNQEAVIIMGALVVVYFLAAFLAYGLSDLYGWYVFTRRVVVSSLEVQRSSKERIDFDQPQPRSSGVQEQEQVQRIIDFEMKRLGKLRTLYIPIIVIRAVFDFLIPFSVGIYAVIALLQLSTASA